MCGLTAIYAKKKNVVGDIYDSLIQVQHRGQDAAGISTWDGSKMSNYKDLGLVTEVFKKADSLNLEGNIGVCLLYTSPSPRDRTRSRMPSSA